MFTEFSNISSQIKYKLLKKSLHYLMANFGKLFDGKLFDVACAAPTTGNIIGRGNLCRYSGF